MYDPYSYSSGAVELENLPLRKDALKEFDLPFEVKTGEALVYSVFLLGYFERHHGLLM